VINVIIRSYKQQLSLFHHLQNRQGMQLHDNMSLNIHYVYIPIWKLRNPTQFLCYAGVCAFKLTSQKFASKIEKKPYLGTIIIREVSHEKLAKSEEYFF